jgi:PAS domain S-box-containing protein
MVEDARDIAELRRRLARSEAEVAELRERVRAGETLHRQMVESATEYAVFSMDLERRVTSWNSGAERVLGWSEAEIVGRVADLMFTPEDCAAGVPAMEAALALQAGRASDERWHQRKDGSRLYASGVMLPLHNEAGKTHGLLKVFRDRTADRLAQDGAQAALRESEARFRNMADHAPLMVWTTDPSGYCTYLNRQWYAFTGQTEAEAEGFGWLDATHPDDKQRAAEAFVSANTANAPFRVEYRLRRADGSYAWAIDLASPRFGEGGEWLGYVGMVVDIDERRRAEEQLRESEARFRALTDSMPAFVWFAGPDGALQYYNDRWYAYTGQTQGQAAGAGWVSVLHPDDVAPASAAWAEALGAGSPYEIKVRYRRADGAYRWYLARAEPLRDEVGAVTAWFGTSVDIDDGERSQEALRASEQRFRSVTEAIPGFAWTATPDGVIDYASQRWYDFSGVDPDEMSSGRWLRLLHRDDADTMLEAWRQAVATGRFYACEYRLRRHDGQFRWFLANAEPLLDAAGRIERWVGVSTDMHEIVETRRALADSAAELQRQAIERAAILAQLAEGVIVADADGRITFVNEAATTLHGVARLDVEPDRYSETYRLFTVDGHPHPTETLPLTRAVRGETVYDARWLIQRPDGAQVLAIGGARPLLAADGTQLGAVLTVRDDTARASVERELRHLNRTLEQRVLAEVAERTKTEEQLRQAQKMEAVGQLTGGIAHDFNNLLAGIVGSLDLLQRRVEAGRIEGLERYTTTAMTSAQRAAALTQRLLAFARRQPLDPKPVEPNRLLAGMEDLLRRTLGPTIELEMVLAGGLWPTLADPNQLDSALLNLAINARDAMPNGGRLTIETANSFLDEAYAKAHAGEVEPGQYVTICVTDTGAGMSPEVMDKVFEPFFTTKPIGQGTGLGLSMLYGFAKQTGGHVKIYSEEGQGTTFRLYLPRWRGGLQPEAPPSDGASNARSQAGETVLVVEDEPAIRMLVVETLVDLGYTAVEAGDGPSGLRILDTEERIDLLITDVGLPGMNGRQLAEAARQMRPALKVLFITGYAHNAAVGNGMLDQGMEILTKPFAVDALAAKIRGMIEAG